MRVDWWLWLVAANLGACVTHDARFVDVNEPKAAVVATLTEKAKAETERSAVATTNALAADLETRTQQGARKIEIDEARAPLVREKLEFLERRLVVARAMATAFDALRARCNSITDLHLSPARCAEIIKIADLANVTVPKVEQALSTLQRQLKAPSDPPVDPPADPPADLPADPPAEPSPSGGAPAGVVLSLPEDLTLEGAVALLAESERELAVDRLLEAQVAELDAIPTGANIDQVEIEVSPYDHLRLARYDHRLLDGKRTRELRGINVYRIVEVDGITRVLRDGKEEFDPEVAKFFGFEGGFKGGSPCLFGELKSIAERCPGAAPNVHAGSISSLAKEGSPRFPRTPRSVPHYAYDQELGSMLGMSGGFAAGVQLRTKGDERGTFSQWNLAALVGIDFDVGINLSKVSESEPRAVAAINPELVLRAGRTEAFHLESDRTIETGHVTLLDLAVGPRFDTYGRHGLSFRATLRPTISFAGVTVRYNRYAEGRGSSIIVGVELANEGALISAAGIVAAAIYGGIIYWIATCEDPEDDHCGNGAP